MKKIILAGGGHGHINILKQLIKKPLHGFDITLVSDYKRQYYSGMLPGFLEGIYTEEKISFDIPALCQKAGVRFVHEKILEIDGASKIVHTSSQELCYDFLSMNLGSRSREDFAIGTNEIYVKPISNIVQFRDVLDINLEQRNHNKKSEEGISPTRDNANTNQPRKKMLIIGGGASGVELAIALHSRYRNLDIKIITKNKQLIPLFNDRSRRLIEKILLQKEIYFRVCEEVLEIKEQQVFTDKVSYPYDFVMISTGFVGCDILFSGFETTKENFVLVDENLCADSFSVAMGDMITLRHAPKTHKAGVFAIRQAPVLYHNLMKIIQEDSALQEYHPQKNYLQVINTGGKTAVFNKSSVAFAGKMAWRLKDYIDRKYMQE